ncbi:cilia- and flagella-associated protein 61 isoform X2 [Drosophila busckii]|uniref:cilia- and flagella-associated protein 61 isoform X2 n=1 Tax=Drosophila busckii TaxID=30019 RepID=UPI00083EDCA8|nr:cilia- and flagella-associated protein 61 isoform X2 [Drosophila busckii]
MHSCHRFYFGRRSFARPEDNDDVIDIIDNEEPEMRVQHGDYFIAELLLGVAGNIDKEKIVVTEETSSTTGGTTGMMWLSEDVNIELLVKNYDLELMGNLVSCTPGADHATVRIHVMCTKEQRHFYRLHSDAICIVRLSCKSLGALTKRERLYSQFKYITDEMNNTSHYLDQVSKTMEVKFDVPHRGTLGGSGGGSARSSRRRHTINNAGKAFLLKNFILSPSLRLEYVYFYLCAMFSAYPEHDYCVVPMPAGTKYSSSVLALLKFFNRVPRRPSCALTEEVFVAHRSSLYTELNLYPLEMDDVHYVKEFLHMAEEPKEEEEEAPSNVKDKQIYRIVNEIIADVMNNQRSEFSFWIIRCGKSAGEREKTTTVGFIVLRPFTNYATVYKQFMLPFDENYLTFERGEIVLLCLHPYFQMWSDELLRTAAIRAGYRELYYMQLSAGLTLPNDLVGKMMPVEPRRYKRNWFVDMNSESFFRRASTGVNLPRINCVKDYFYLYCHNLCPSKYIGNPTSLVILGCSNICKAFLRLMLFGWNTPDFKNTSVNNCLPSVSITVIVEPGRMEAEYDQDFHCAYCSDVRTCFVRSATCAPFVYDTTRRMDLRNWIHFVPGRLKHIDCAKKIVVLKSNCKIHYEKLLLFCETSYGLPESCIESKPARFKLPYNYVELNNRLDRTMLYQKLHKLNQSDLSEKRVLIYGDKLAVYECIDFLLKHGLQGSQIIYIQPHRVAKPETLNNPTEDSNLDRILLNMLKDLGISTHVSMNFVDFTVHQTANFIDLVHFKKFNSAQLQAYRCDLFINFGERLLNYAEERVFESSGILLDKGKILVNDSYCTNDPNIYAAGKHVNMFDNCSYQYIYTSEYETAEKLIYILHLSTEQIKFEQKYKRPCLYQAMLPMGYMITKITTPKRYLMNRLPNEYSRSMTTYHEGDFCRIRLSSTLNVQEIVCVTRKLDRQLYFLEFFCGKHDSLLNNLSSRWNMGRIKCFVHFFQLPWTEYIMHDRFHELQTKNHASLVSLLIETQNLSGRISDLDARVNKACREALHANLLKFLRTHRKEFVNEFALPEDFS